VKLKNNKILYLHGFASCGEGNKSSELKKYFGEGNVLSPDLSPSPFDTITMVERLLRSEDIGLIIGSSLGGFYATYLAEKYQMRAVLLNPSTEPWKTLAPYVGWQQRFCDEEVFEFKSVYLEQLQTLEVLPGKGKIFFFYKVMMRS